MSKRVATIAALVALPAAVALSFSAFWRRNREASDPSGSLPPEEYRELLEIVGTYFALRNCRAAFDGGDVVVDGPAGRARYPLAEIAESCQNHKRHLWPALVGQHFASLSGDAQPVPVAPFKRTVPPPPAPDEAPAEPRAPAEPAPSWPQESSGASEGGRSAPSELPAERPQRPLATEPGNPPASRPTAPSRRSTPVERSAPPAGASSRPLPPVRPVRPEQVAPPAEDSAPPARPASPGAGEPAAPAQQAWSGEQATGGGDWRAFSAMVQECFRRHGFEATVGPEGVRGRNGAGREQEFPAPGLARVPAELPEAQWPRFIDSTFGEPLRHLRRGEALAGRSFDEVRDLLAIQLFPASALTAEEREATIYSDDIPGLLSAIVCRLPQGAVRLAPGVLRGWGVGAEEAFVTALDNLRALRPAARRLALAGGAQGLCLEGGEDFAAAQALLLGESAECSGPYGAIVALPQRGLLLACPLRPLPGASGVYAGALTGLVSRALEAEQEGQAPLARSLYWYHEGRFTELPYEVQTVDGEPAVDLDAPDEFVAALEALDGGGAGG